MENTTAGRKAFRKLQCKRLQKETTEEDTTQEESAEVVEQEVVEEFLKNEISTENQKLLNFRKAAYG
ncbi:MAG: hypothetical protein ACLS9K_05245 [Lachnospira eligens]